MTNVTWSYRQPGHRQAVRPAWLIAVMGTAILLDLAFQQATHDVSPGLFLLPAVIAVAVAGGPVAGGAAALAAVAFAAVDLARGCTLAAPPADRVVRLAVIGVVAPSAAIVVGALRRRVVMVSDERLRRGVEAERDRADACTQIVAAERDLLVHQRDAFADTAGESQRRLADLIAAVPGIVWEADVDPAGRLRVKFVSRHVERLLGYDVGKWIDDPDLWLAAIHPDDRDAVRHKIEGFVAGNPANTAAAVEPLPSEFRWIALDGTERWLETRVVEVRSPIGSRTRHVGLRGVTWDVSVRHRLDADLRDRAVELAAVARRLSESNAELDQFAYVASHDLKAPLRGIANLSTWIEEDLGPERVTAEAHAQFELLRGRVHRMDGLIDGLLQYSQVGRTAGTVEWVDVAQLLADVIDWIGPPPHIKVDVGPNLPVFNADRLRLGQVLANLVGNAVKHHHPTGGSVRVTVEPTEDGDGFNFAVTDDGPGIDPRFHDRIFGVFQTLHPRDKVEGTGIGLALVRKVVTAKGQTVNVESAVGQGATFRFGWPRLDPSIAPEPPATKPAANSTRCPRANPQDPQ